jgi:hypothetical protein
VIIFKVQRCKTRTFLRLGRYHSKMCFTMVFLLIRLNAEGRFSLKSGDYLNFAKIMCSSILRCIVDRYPFHFSEMCT